MPNDIPIHLIKVGLGSTWVPTNVYEKFFSEKFGVRATTTTKTSHRYLDYLQ